MYIIYKHYIVDRSVFSTSFIWYIYICSSFTNTRLWIDLYSLLRWSDSFDPSLSLSLSPSFSLHHSPDYLSVQLSYSPLFPLLERSILGYAPCMVSSGACQSHEHGLGACSRAGMESLATPHSAWGGGNVSSFFSLNLFCMSHYKNMYFIIYRNI